MPPAIPDRWIPYKACGNVIEGTRFICFKVPLRKSVQTGNREIKEIWDLKALRDKIPKLGAVIDLTNTYRYYDPRELVALGVLHRKILMPGRVIPPNKTIKEFMDTVDEFLGSDCEYLIGVHCTHGLNRTGYMVCRYMRDRLGIAPEDAIKKFEKARGYQMERENYIADLLGNKPSPPDLGKSTNPKPIHDKQDLTYKSPVNDDYGEEEEHFGPYKNKYIRYTRYPDTTSRSNGRYENAGSWRNQRNDTNNYQDSSSWRKSHKNKEDLSWRKKDNSSEDNNRGFKDRRKSNTGKSYDYKYDY